MNIEILYFYIFIVMDIDCNFYYKLIFKMVIEEYKNYDNFC